MEGVDAEIYWLQEQLSQDGINLDNSLLSGMFLDDEANGNFLKSLPSSSSTNSTTTSGSNNTTKPHEITGNELTQYMPSSLSALPLDLDLSGVSSSVPSNVGGNDILSDLSSLLVPNESATLGHNSGEKHSLASVLGADLGADLIPVEEQPEESPRKRMRV
jgi:hypothetical protein